MQGAKILTVGSKGEGKNMKKTTSNCRHASLMMKKLQNIVDEPLLSSNLPPSPCRCLLCMQINKEKQFPLPSQCLWNEAKRIEPNGK